MATNVEVMRAVGRAALHGLAELVAPRGCSSCDARLPRRAAFCEACASTVERAAPPSAAEVPAFGLYGGALATALRRLKYEGRPDLAGPLGELLRALAAASASEVDRVVPVPLHPVRLAERGYNQAALLAHAVVAATGAPLEVRALARCRDTAHQARLGREARHENMRGAFVVRAPSRVRGARVLLVDDVATTGSTLEACRAALEEAGARRVTSLVVARGL